MISNPDDDPSQKAVILIDKLTVALGDLKRQVDANAQATASLSKSNEELRQKVDSLRFPLPVAVPTQPVSATKSDLDNIERRLDDRLLGLHARFYALLAVSVMGLISVVVLTVKTLS